jgi:hypothetical protein
MSKKSEHSLFLRGQAFSKNRRSSFLNSVTKCRSALLYNEKFHPKREHQVLFWRFAKMCNPLIEVCFLVSVMNEAIFLNGWN